MVRWACMVWSVAGRLECTGARAEGSWLPTYQNGTCLVHFQGSNWHVREGGLAEGGRT